MRTKLILRLVLAIIFAASAVLFSELLPPLNGVDTFFMRSFLTIVAGSVGFLIFPDLSLKVSATSISFFNFVVNRATNEILNQLLKLPKQAHLPFLSSSTHNSSITISYPLIVDTSAIIDARILDIAKSGFLYGSLLIPNYVLTELQQVADSADVLKRQRARNGFNVIEELKKLKNIRVEIWDKGTEGKDVDNKLLTLAKNLHGKIITCDFNLNKVATVSNVGVLNINDLANALKSFAIPGEKMKLKIVHIGKDTSQGVGYLNDGTMIIVRNGAAQVGKTIEVEVTKSLQTSSGRMIFASKVN